MSDPARCMSCGENLRWDEIEAGAVAAPTDELSVHAPYVGRVYFLCSFCRDRVRITWTPQGAPHRVCGPTWHEPQ